MYRYKVSFTSNYKETGKYYETETGLVAGSSYADACRKVCDYYGDELVEVHLIQWHDLLNDDEVRDAISD